MSLSQLWWELVDGLAFKLSAGSCAACACDTGVRNRQQGFFLSQQHIFPVSLTCSSRADADVVLSLWLGESIGAPPADCIALQNRIAALLPATSQCLSDRGFQLVHPVGGSLVTVAHLPQNLLLACPQHNQKLDEPLGKLVSRLRTLLTTAGTLPADLQVIDSYLYERIQQMADWRRTSWLVSHQDHGILGVLADDSHTLLRGLLLAYEHIDSNRTGAGVDWGMLEEYPPEKLIALKVIVRGVAEYRLHKQLGQPWQEDLTRQIDGLLAATAGGGVSPRARHRAFLETLVVARIREFARIVTRFLCVENIIDLSLWLRPHGWRTIARILGGADGYSTKSDDIRRLQAYPQIVYDAARAIPWPVGYIRPAWHGARGTFLQELLRPQRTAFYIDRTVRANYRVITGMVRGRLHTIWRRPLQTRTCDPLREQIAISINRTAAEVIEVLAGAVEGRTIGMGMK